MLPTREEAEKILKEAEESNHGAWANHCRVAAYCAEKIALACGDLDADKDKVILNRIRKCYYYEYI